MAKASDCFAARMNVVSRAMTSSADCSPSARKNTETLSIDEMLNWPSFVGRCNSTDGYRIAESCSDGRAGNLSMKFAADPFDRLRAGYAAATALRVKDLSYFFVR